jgi:hypothetical protein
MSQSTVLELLRHLGRATTKQIAELAMERYPGLSLHLYVGDRLNKLHKWGIVDKGKDGFWYIVAPVESRT